MILIKFITNFITFHVYLHLSCTFLEKITLKQSLNKPLFFHYRINNAGSS